MENRNMKPLVIANYGDENTGKSGSLVALGKLFGEIDPNKLTFDRVLKDGKMRVEVNGIVTIGGVKIGIESRGDDENTVRASIKYFLDQDCKIIVNACRNRATVRCIDQELHKGENNWDLIWCKNEIYYGEKNEEANIKLLNQRYAERVFQLIRDRIAGRI